LAVYRRTRFRLSGDRGVLLEFGDEVSPEVNEKVRRAAMAIRKARMEGIVELMPAYQSLLVVYEPLVVSVKALRRSLESLDEALEDARPEPPSLTRIPVVYGGSFGPDLEEVAAYQRISPDEVVRLHCSRDYRIYMIGFMPGFPYLGDLPDALVTPRRKTPRVCVPAGSVAIAQTQTGIYPVESPGGWRIIGRTPLKLFDVSKNPPVPLEPGNSVRFYSIHKEEYDGLCGADRSL
jgi:inhibitor of KinA